MISKRRILLSCFVLVCQLILGQTKNTSDTLFQKSFDYLESRFKSNLANDSKGKIYLDAYLKKAKMQEVDSLLLKGYYFQAFISNFDNAIAYYDSIINYNHSENKLLPFALDEKGYLFYEKGNYKKSLESYLQARQVSEENGNNLVLLKSTYSIGLIKSLIGQKEEALEIYKEQFKNFGSTDLETVFPDLYLESLFSLSDSYITNSKLDSATIYNKIGIKESVEMNEPNYYPRFVLIEGINLYRKEDFTTASDSLTKAIELLTRLNDSSSLAMGYLFKAKTLEKQLGNLSVTIELLKKADKLASKQNPQPDFSPIYETLYENYKKTDSVEQQLVYLEKFIDYNKKLENEFKGIDATLYTQYDVPELLNEKEEIILGLKEKDEINQRNIHLLSIFLVASGILSFYYYRKRVIFKRRYDALIQQDFTTKEIIKDTQEIQKTHSIPTEIFEQLLPKIAEFEQKKGFLDSALTQNKMAKALGSNSNYLSKTINHTKNKNFSSYLSDLRIEYAINELQNNPKLLNYTIKAIAAEVGFGNSESFTKAFQAKTNLYPSYFIKQLKKEK